MSDQQQQARFQQFIHPSSLGLDVGKPQPHAMLDVMSQQMSPPNSAGSAASPYFHPYTQHPAHHSPFPPTMHTGSPTPMLSSSSSQALSLDPSELRAPSSGPSRVLTRRQARMAQSTHHPYTTSGRTTGASSGAQDAHHHQSFDEGFGLYNGLSRPQTPNTFSSGQAFNDQGISMPDLSFGSIDTSHSMSPPHPGTPASAASSTNFSTYGFNQYPSNGHMRTVSGSTNKRSTSPASVLSAVTSISSGPAPKQARSRPPVSTGSNANGFPSYLPESPLPQLPAVKPKRRLLNKQRKEICQYHIDHPNTRQEDIAAQWGVERSTVSKILKHKNRWLAVDEGESEVIAKHRPAKFAIVEEQMHDWLVECTKTRTQITDVMIRTKAREVAKDCGLGDDKFKASAGWVENFKHRMNIKKGIYEGVKDPGLFPPDEADEGYTTIEEFMPRYQDARINSLLPYGLDALRQAGELTTSTDGIQGAGHSWNPSLSMGISNSAHQAPSESMGRKQDEPANVSSNQASQQQTMSTVPIPGVSMAQHVTDARDRYLAHGGTALITLGSTAGPIEGPSAKEAYDALEVVVEFLKGHQNNHIHITSAQRMAMTDIKTALFVLTNTSNSTSPTSATSNPGATLVLNGDTSNSGGDTLQSVEVVHQQS